MRKKNKILFLVNTEYVLLMSLLYYLKNFTERDICPIFIIINSNPNRFKDLNLNDLPGKNYCFPNELISSKINPNREFLKVLEFENIEEIAFQNPHFFVNQIIINGLKKMYPSCLLTLISDSVAIDRILFTRKKLLKYYILLFFRKFVNQFRLLSCSIWTYTKIPYKIDGLIAHRIMASEKFYDTTFLLNSLPDNIQLVNKIFNSNIDQFLDCDIIFFTQPILNYASISKNNKDKYLELLRIIAGLAEKRRKMVILKIHPGENENAYSEFENEFVRICKNTKNLPAEIIINVISDKSIVSICSSISAYDVKNSNRHFWLNNIIGLKIEILSKSSIVLIQDVHELENKIFS